MPEAPAKPTILIADDDFSMRLLATEALESAGFVVHAFESGEVALARFAGLRPDVALLDVMMPGLDGYETCRRIRAFPYGAAIPILMLTGLDDVGSIDEAYVAGATDFITKPVNYALLPYRVRYLLRAAGAFRKAREGELRLARAQRLARLAQWELDLEHDCFVWSVEAQEILGIPVAAADQGLLALTHWVHPADRERVEAVLASPAPHQVDFRMVLPDGRERFIHQDVEVVTELDGTGPKLVGAVQDMTERWLAERQITELSYYDTLTQLPNRVYVKQCLEQALARAEREEQSMAVLALDLDLFKRVNDMLGHAAGDNLLAEVAVRLRQCIRAPEPWGGGTGRCAAAEQRSAEALAARLGGDEFIVLLPGIRSSEEVAAVSRQILERLSDPYRLNGTEITLSTSIGIAVYPSDGTTAEDLFEHADAAMYHAKDRGRNNFQFFTTAIHDEAVRRVQIENRLFVSLSDGTVDPAIAGSRAGFSLHFQPKVTLTSRRVVGFEALVRWHCEELGTVSPAEFIPVAENTGLIVPLGRWILHDACRFGASLDDDLRVAVNISARQLREPDFVEMVTAVLESTGLPAQRLELEITEGVVMSDSADNLAALSQLKRLGVRIALDDFGTGYSSLSYLTRFPIDILKIDRSFVKDLGKTKSNAIVSAIIALARSLDVEVVVEGVETEEQLGFFSGSGDVEIQGYYFARPMPEASVAGWLRGQQALAVKRAS
jgi:predicted signal transduction protein with EAL and GGDEF domain/DNA-binding response OmpR family regulator